jgi:hypothetical protein
MTIVFVLDLSESMLQYIDDVKEALLKLHRDAYRYRDKVGLVAFKEMGAIVVQHPTANLRLVANKLFRLRMSGFTPLATGMLKALEVLKEARRRDSSTIPAMVVMTDGDANVPLRRDLLTGEYRQFDPLDAAFFKYEDEAIDDVFSVAVMIKKESIHTVVIEMTSPVTLGDRPRGYGSYTTRGLAAIAGGAHYEASEGRVRSLDQWDMGISEVMLRVQKRFSRSAQPSATSLLA